MENFPSDWDMKNLVKELTEGRQVAKRLQIDLNINVQSSSPHETREFLLDKIINSYDKALSMIKHGRCGGGDAPPAVVVAALDSPRSLIESPHTDDSDQDLEASRKRKGVPRWTKKVKVCPEREIEEQLDDGFCWRKYGQKDILGAIYPRGYYRCTHRNNQGCLATKQVQRSNDDPTMYEITYRRNHTCSPRANPGNKNNNDPPTAMPHPRNEDPNLLPENPLQLIPENQLINTQTGLTVITQDLGLKENPSFGPFNFPSSSTINHENNKNFLGGNDFLGNYSPNLMSLVTSESNYYPISPHVMNNNNYDGIVSNLYTSGSELTPIVAPITSSTNSPTLDVHFLFGSSEFGSNFGFGDPGYYP